MMRVVIFVVLIWGLLGCSSKNEKVMRHAFDARMAEHISLQKSEKIEITSEGEIAIALTATYINAKDSLEDNTSNEKFIIGLYHDENISSMSLNSGEENLTLYGTLPLIVTELQADDKLLKTMPFVNQWSSYYLVEFPHIHTTANFSLIYQHNLLGLNEIQQHTLLFSKMGKYLSSSRKKLF